VLQFIEEKLGNNFFCNTWWYNVVMGTLNPAHSLMSSLMTNDYVIYGESAGH